MPWTSTFQSATTGQVIRRVTDSTIGEFVQAEIARPLGVDYFIGTPSSEHHRIAPLVMSPVAAAAPTSATAAATATATATANELASRMFAPVYPPISPPWNSPEFWSAEIPVTNGICTARALATIYGELARDGGSLVSRDAVAAMAALVYDGVDEVQQVPVRRTLGFELRPDWADDGRPDHAFGHPGAGGYLSFADPQARVGFAYVKYAGSPVPGQPDPRAGPLI